MEDKIKEAVRVYDKIVKVYSKYHYDQLLQYQLTKFSSLLKGTKVLDAGCGPGRDANWQTILERIGEKRWNTQTLVQDYIGAMASMLTIPELEKMLLSLGINRFSISDGSYPSMNGKDNSRNLKEFAQDVEYTCVIEK